MAPMKLRRCSKEKQEDTNTMTDLSVLSFTEGTYNFTSTQPSQHPIITQIESDQDELGNNEIIFPDYENNFAYQGQDDTDAIEDDSANVERLKEMP
uniref:Uncharacterized protein n=1 Tax=Oryza punctata TaxID=4537 RepID=A0A0E0LAE7_ORYPU